MCETCDKYADDDARLADYIDHGFREQLKMMVTLRDLGGVLMLLSHVAGEQADELATKDSQAARAVSWERDASLIERLAGRLEN